MNSSLLRIAFDALVPRRVPSAQPPRGGGTRGADTQRGQSIVEFALALPLVLAVIFGTVDLGRAVFDYNTITNAAREGARYAITSSSVSTSTIISTVQSFASVLNLSSTNCPSSGSNTICVTCQSNTDGTTSITCDQASSADFVTVQVQYQYVPIVSSYVKVGSGGITLTTTSQMAIQ